MKKALTIAGAIIAATIIIMVYKIDATTDPYVISPITVQPASSDSKVGHTVDPVSRILSVVSSREVIVVGDPGASFSHEILWLLEVPRKDGSNNLMIYRAKLPSFADSAHINSLGSVAPQKVTKLLDRANWK